MKLRNIFLGTALFVSASVVNAATSFLITDGNINFAYEAGALSGGTLAIFDEVADIGGLDSLVVDVPDKVFYTAPTLTSNKSGDTLDIDGDFVVAYFDGSIWHEGDVDMGHAFTNPEADAYAVKFAGIGGFELLIDVTPVPVPAAVWLFGTGLLGLVGVARRRA